MNEEKKSAVSDGGAADIEQQRGEHVDADIAEAVATDQALEDDTDTLDERIEQELVDEREHKIARLEDQALRLQAEMQNLRKRTEGEIEKARKFALERFAKELLNVADNLERGIDAAQDTQEVKLIVDGMQLTLKSLSDVMQQFNIVAIEPHGEPFNPEFHQAISMVEAPDAEPNSVIDVVQKGYSLNERVLRAAMVVVAKA